MLCDSSIERIGADSLAAATLPDALAAAAWQLEVPLPHERRGVLREEAARLVDSLLARVARGRGALDVAIGEGLAFLAVGDRALQLGYSGIGDYALDRLGIAARTAQGMARLARELRSRPLLAAAVRAGEVSARKAEVILPVARGDDEHGWVDRARTSTVRALTADVRAHRGSDAASAADPEEPFESVELAVGPEARARLDEALDLAGKLLGRGATRWQRLEAICQEFLSSHPAPARGDQEDDEDAASNGAVADWLASAREALEEETACWAALDPVSPAAAPAAGNAAERGDLHALDAELRSLAAMRARWDELVGHLALLLQTLGLWRDMGCASFQHYCEERLGMSGRAVGQRAALERRLHALPPLRAALRDRRLSYEQARLVASAADEATVQEWIAHAERSTCVALRRELETSSDAQMCARSELVVRVPSRVAGLVDDAFRAARAAAGRWLTPEECLVQLCDHFVATWREALRGRRSRSEKVIGRDRGWCQVPGCSRPAAHVHHVLYRSRGGADDGQNLVSLCAGHPLHGVHRGFIRVRGRAPDALVWELGVSGGAPPLAVLRTAAA